MGQKVIGLIRPIKKNLRSRCCPMSITQPKLRKPVEDEVDLRPVRSEAIAPQGTQRYARDHITRSGILWLFLRGVWTGICESPREIQIERFLRNKPKEYS